jgi:hypothetical protein
MPGRTRAEIRAEANGKLSTLQIGDSAYFLVSAEQPGRRVLCQAINQVAYELWGSAAYRMESAAAGVKVTRTSVRTLSAPLACLRALRRRIEPERKPWHL